MVSANLPPGSPPNITNTGITEIISDSAALPKKGENLLYTDRDSKTNLSYPTSPHFVFPIFLILGMPLYLELRKHFKMKIDNNRICRPVQCKAKKLQHLSILQQHTGSHVLIMVSPF